MKSFLSILAAWAVAAPAVAAEQPILPGLWESQNKVSFPISDESVSRQCITAEKVTQFLSGPSTRNFKCEYSRSHVAAGVVEAAGKCSDKNGLTSSIDVRGTYTQTRFKLDAELTINLAGLPIPVRASTVAQRISADCPDAPK